MTAFGSRWLLALPLGILVGCAQDRFSLATAYGDAGLLADHPDPTTTGFSPTLPPGTTVPPQPSDPNDTDALGSDGAFGPSGTQPPTDRPQTEGPNGTQEAGDAANTGDTASTDDTANTSTDDGVETDDAFATDEPVFDGPPATPAPECGNEITEVGEACDDGNDIDDDDCSNQCTLAGCGDGILQPAREACDDGNTINNDECTNQCNRPRCGDGIVSMDEGCEDGNQLDGDGCSAQCQVEGCGDGDVSGDETCDDGNHDNGDGCSAGCQTEVCGDGDTIGNEQCDDGNLVDNDGCSKDCKNEVCGDGIVQSPREQCEDLNTVDTDVCRNGCMHAASLNSLSSSCALANQITQTVCMVATANWCKQYNHNPIAGMVTGAKADNEFTVGCIVGFQRRDVSTSQLDQCPGGRQQSPACLEQVNAACVGLGFARGFYLGVGSNGTYALACDSGATTTESIQGCNGIGDTNPVPVACAQALSSKCGSGKGGMIQARAQSDRVTYTCIDLSLTGSVRQF